MWPTCDERVTTVRRCRSGAGLSLMWACTNFWMGPPSAAGPTTPSVASTSSVWLPLSVTMPASVPGRGALAVLAVLHASGTAPNPVVSGTWSGEAVVLAHGVAGAERSTLAVLVLDDSAATILSASSQTQVSVHVVGWFG